MFLDQWQHLQSVSQEYFKCHFDALRQLFSGRFPKNDFKPPVHLPEDVLRQLIPRKTPKNVFGPLVHLSEKWMLAMHQELQDFFL